MIRNDPFPGKELLDRAEVRQLLGMERSTFERWLKSEIARMFPRPVTIDVVGKKKRPVLKWRKHQVLSFIDLLPDAPPGAESSTG